MHQSCPLWVHQSLQRWLWPEDRASLARREDFPIPCPAFRCSLICRLYFYLPSSPASGLSAFIHSLCPSAEGEAASAAPIRGPSAGDWACCPPLAPQAHSSSTFLRLAPDDASLPASLPPPLPVCLPSLPFPPELVAPQGVRGEWKAFCRPRAGSSPSAVLWGEANWCTFQEAASVQLLETLTLIMLSQLLPVYTWNCCC